MPKNTVLVVSLVLSIIIGIWAVVAPTQVTDAATALTSAALSRLDWFFLLSSTLFLIIALYLAFGPYGDIKLGKDDDEPDFSTASWIAMLFAGGMGAGLLFWGVAEPIYHFTSPPGMQGGTPEAAYMAFAFTNLHWGLHAWSIYGVCALVIAYFTFRHDQPSLVSTPVLHALRPVLGERSAQRIGTLSDIIAVMAVLFGLAGSLGMGIAQVRAGMHLVFGTPDSVFMGIVILVALTALYLLSACTGVDKGIKILSNINMVIAILLMVFILLFGPTAFILETFVNSIGAYLSQLPRLSFRLFTFDPSLAEWSRGWTLTYFIWWIAWGPFVGVFVARISRGRTIREFVLGVVFAPTIFSIFWFACFGGGALYIEQFGGGGLSQIVFQDVSKALFAFFGYFPFSQVTSILGALLVFIFLVTSADSGTFVLAMMTHNGDLNPPTRFKLAWGILIAAITVSVVFTGTYTVAKAMAITGAIPFVFIILIQLVGFMRAIREERPGKRKPAQPTAAPAID